MIRRKVSDGWLLFTQPDHAQLAGELASHWGNEAFARPKPYDDVLLAVAEHDNGWQELDAEPKFNPENGLPYSFSEWPLPKHFPIWQRAEKRFLSRSPYASVLISRHGSTLFRSLVDHNLDPLLVHPFFAQKTWRAMSGNLPNKDRKEVLEFVGEREAFQAKTLQELKSNAVMAEASKPERLNASFRLVQVCDALSLYAVLEPPQEKILENIARSGWDDRVTLHLHPVDETTVILDPYPFDASPVTVEIMGRKLPVGPFQNDDELSEAWTKGATETLRFAFVKQG